MGVLRARVSGQWVDIGVSPGGDTPIGSIISYAGSAVPNGYLACDGAAVSRAVYPDLFTAIGTAWGAGDGSTTFNVPDLMGRAPIGMGTGSGLTARPLAGKVGTEAHLLSATEMPSHTHVQNAHTHTQNAHSHSLYDAGFVVGVQNIAPPGGGSGYYSRHTTAALSITSDIATNQNAIPTNQNTGGGVAHNNMQPSVVVMFLIRAFTVIPAPTTVDPFIGFGGAYNQSIAIGAQVPAVWTAEAFDSHGFHAAGSDTIIIPAGFGGTYAINVTHNSQVNATSHCVLTIDKAGSTTGLWLGYIYSGTNSQTMQAVTPFVAGDTIKARIHNATTSAQFFNGAINVIRVAA